MALCTELVFDFIFEICKSFLSFIHAPEIWYSYAPDFSWIFLNGCVKFALASGIRYNSNRCTRKMMKYFSFDYNRFISNPVLKRCVELLFTWPSQRRFARGCGVTTVVVAYIVWLEWLSNSNHDFVCHCTLQQINTYLCAFSVYTLYTDDADCCW